MRLADPRRPEQKQRIAVGHPAASGELAKLLLVERGLGGEVEAVEIAQGREVGDLGRHLDAPFVAPADLALAQKGHRVAQAQLALGGFVEQAVELIADGGQLQPGQHVGERLAIGVHDQSPPAACSYSDRGRSSSGSATAGAGAVAGWLAANCGRPNAGEVGGDHHALAAAGDLAMAGDFAAAMADADPPAGDRPPPPSRRSAARARYRNWCRPRSWRRSGPGG